MITRLKKQRNTNYVRGVVVSCGHLNVRKKGRQQQQQCNAI